MSDYSDFIGFLTNRKEAAVTPESQPELTLLERAKELRLKHASHNQASHGFRFGKTPSLGQARRYRKSGVLQEYSRRARERSGTKPAKERQANRQANTKRIIDKGIGNERGLFTAQNPPKNLKEAVRSGMAWKTKVGGRPVVVNSKNLTNYRLYHSGRDIRLVSPYKQNVIDTVKRLGGRWSGVSSSWGLPSGLDIRQLIQELPELDNLTLNIDGILSQGLIE